LDDELSLPEISTILEIPVGTVKSHVHRAKALLLEILQSKEKTND
jgi:DNA-directed RNA polymerase specialized sigma24 family protein